jgi:hypothetical protein
MNLIREIRDKTHAQQPGWSGLMKLVGVAAKDTDSRSTGTFYGSTIE